MYDPVLGMMLSPDPLIKTVYTLKTTTDTLMPIIIH